MLMKETVGITSLLLWQRFHIDIKYRSSATEKIVKATLKQADVQT